MVAKAVWGAALAPSVFRVGKGAAQRATGEGEDPAAITADAANPAIPAWEVLARAKIRSRSGKLVANVERLIAARAHRPSE